MDFLILIVSYKSNPYETTTFLTALDSVSRIKSGFFNFELVDNTEYSYGIDFYKPKNVVEVEKTLDVNINIKKYNNDSLSRIYNDYVSSVYDYIIVLDHDTSLSLDYFVSIFEAIKNNATIMVPRVVVNENVHSPRFEPLLVDYIDRHKIKSIPRHVSGFCSSVDFFAVMSGTCISNRVFRKGVTFDERLDFYGIDSKFFYDIGFTFDEVYILNVDVKHSLSYFEKLTVDDFLWRFLKREDAKIRISRILKIKKIRVIFIGLLKSLFFSLRFKNIKVISLYLGLLIGKSL